jgi:hypothetical protein
VRHFTLFVVQARVLSARRQYIKHVVFKEAGKSLRQYLQPAIKVVVGPARIVNCICTVPWPCNTARTSRSGALAGCCHRATWDSNIKPAAAVLGLYSCSACMASICYWIRVTQSMFHQVG